MDYINIGSAPFDEDCVQVGDADYYRKSRIESKAFIHAIRKKLGPEPDRAMLRIKEFPHDFGSYIEVVCLYDENDEEATAYAMKCESESPATWEEVGMKNPLKGGENVGIDQSHTLCAESTQSRNEIG